MTPEIESYLAYMQDSDHSKNTINNNRYILARFADWFEQATRKPMTPAIVTPLDVRQYRRSEQDKRLAVGTVNRKLIALKSFFKWAMAEGLCKSNPTKSIKLIKRVKQSPKWLTRQETYAVLRAAEEAVQVADLKGNKPTAYVARRTMAAIALMLHAGLRISEVTNLGPVDVVIGDRSGKVIVWEGKGNKYREVPLNVDVREVLSGWLDVWQGKTWLFDNRQTGDKLHTYTLQFALKQIGAAARLTERLTPHRLRHTFGKNLVDAGVSLDRVAALMGHSSINTTMIYTMPSLADLESEVERIAWSD